MLHIVSLDFTSLVNLATLLLLGSVQWWSPGAFASTCTTQEVAVCMSEVSEFWSSIYEHVPHVELNIVDQCRKSRAAITCLHNLKDDCDVADRHVINGQIDSMYFLCNNQDVYLRNIICLGIPQTAHNISRCLHPETVYQSAGSATEVCSVSHQDLECVKTHVTSDCGKEAGWLMYWFEYLFIEGLHEELKCSVIVPPTKTAINFTYTDVSHSAEEDVNCQRIVNQMCLHELLTHYELVNEYSFGNMTVQQLRTECNHLLNMTLCMKMQLSVLDTLCHDLHVRQFEGNIAEIEYTCRDQFDVYLEHRECLNSYKLEQKIDECLDTSDMQFEDEHALCADLEESQQCVHEEVSDECGPEAGEFQYERIRLNEEPILEYLGCDEPDSGASTDHVSDKTHTMPVSTAVGLIIGISLLVVLVYTAIVVLVCFGRGILTKEGIRASVRRLKNQQQGAQRFHNEPGVPSVTMSGAAPSHSTTAAASPYEVAAPPGGAGGNAHPVSAHNADGDGYIDFTVRDTRSGDNSTA